MATRNFNPACFLLMFSGPIVVTYHYNFILYIILYPHYISTMYGEYPINSPNHWTYDHQSPSFLSWTLGASPKNHDTTGRILEPRDGWSHPFSLLVAQHEGQRPRLSVRTEWRPWLCCGWGRPEAMKTNLPTNTAVRSFGSPQGLQSLEWWWYCDFIDHGVYIMGVNMNVYIYIYYWIQFQSGI